jgi:glutamine synthetase
MCHTTEFSARNAIQQGSRIFPVVSGGGQPGEAATHLENRVGEPAANPYLYMAAQIYAGLDGVAREPEPGQSADMPYDTKAEPLPKSLAEAIAALRADRCFRGGFGQGFIDYYAHIKEAEIACFETDRRAQAEESAEVTGWEQKEYLDLF